MTTRQGPPTRRGRHTRRPSISPERFSLALVLWGIALTALFSIPLGGIPVISLIPTLLKGLLGLGYYFIPISFFAGGYLLLVHTEWPGGLQVSAACALPIPIGCLHHAVFCAEEASQSPAPSLWETGLTLHSGGVISGGAARALLSVSGIAGAVILFTILVIALLGIAFLPCLLEKKSKTEKPPHTSKSFGSYGPTISQGGKRAAAHSPSQNVRSAAASQSKMSAYDIPMDGDRAEEKHPADPDFEETVSDGFYRPKTDDIYTPAEIMAQIWGAQTLSDIPPEPAPAESPNAGKRQDASVRPSKADRQTPWTPFVWTPTVRSEPAWAIPHPADKAQESAQTEAPGEIQPGGPEGQEKQAELAADARELSENASPRQANPEPEPAQLRTAENTAAALSDKDIFKDQAGRSASSLLPSAPAVPLLPEMPRRLLLPVHEEISSSKEAEESDEARLPEKELSAGKSVSFLLIGYIPPRKRVRYPHNSAKVPLLLPGKTELLLNAHTKPPHADIDPQGRTPAYAPPPLALLHAQPAAGTLEDTAILQINAEHLNDVLTSFGVKATCGEVVCGPAVTRYEFTLHRGVKLSKVTNLADDIALALGAGGVRIAPIPGKVSVVGIEVPNKQIAPVYIREVLDSDEFKTHRSPVAFAIGKDIGNRSVVGDIAKLPHILIAGTTGSGKSVCTNSLIISILCKTSPHDVKFIMIDPKMVELAPYNGIPHLLIPVVTDPRKAAGALQWAVFEMMKRYRTFSELGAKKLAEYNALAEAEKGIEPMPAIVIVIDELADLMLAAAKEVEESICRIAQMGRAAGMHLVIATQRPSSDVITGLMKANIPSRIAFAVASSLESRIILDSSGAEKLVGRGDMLYSPLGTAKPLRVQGCYIAPEEIERVAAYVKSTEEVQYSDEVMEKIESSVREKETGGRDEPHVSPMADPVDDEDENLLKSAVEISLECGQASVSMLQRRLKLGYARAARIVDTMEERGYVGPFEGSKPRRLLISKESWREICSGDSDSAGDGGEDEAEETEDAFSQIGRERSGAARHVTDAFPVETAPRSAAVQKAPSQLPQSPFPAERHRKIGRNEPCPCGSGKKYKKCCGRWI